MHGAYRHPVRIPIRYTVLEGHDEAPHHEILEHVSGSGVSFKSSGPVSLGTRVRVDIRVAIPPFEAEAIVTSCKEAQGDYEIEVRFTDDKNNYKLRMVQQVCQIEQYKLDVFEAQGRRLSNEEAAREWIAKNAANFPD